MRKLWNHYEPLPDFEPNPEEPGEDIINRSQWGIIPLWERLKSWLLLEEHKAEEAPPPACTAQPALVTAVQDPYDRKREIEKALMQWKNAKTFFENATDPTLVDYAVYEMEAARKRYIYLLQTIRQDKPAGELPKEL